MLRTLNPLFPFKASRRPGQQPLPRPIAHAAAPAVAAAIGAIGRTEDIQFSPDERRLAICGFMRDRLLVLDVERGGGPGRAGLSFPRHREIACAAFRRPHGVSWLDGETLAVANREGEVVVVRLPAPEARAPLPATASPITIEPLATIHADAADGLDAPGSVAAVSLGGGRFELLVCNNNGNTVSAHIVAAGAGGGVAVESSATLMARGLAIPDSVAAGPGARWIAVSNHLEHCVFLYRNTRGLNPASPPDGVLRGVLYPHGLRFSADGRRLFVADAGLPFVQVYAGAGGAWHGERYPVHSLRIMDDATYLAGRHNPQEGGPKGLDLTADGAILVVTCEEAPFLCFDLGGTDAATRPALHRAAPPVPMTPPRAAMSAEMARERHRRIAGAAVAAS